MDDELEISTKPNFDPLPIYDNNLFNEKFDENQLKINVNLFSLKKTCFVPNKSIEIEMTVERKSLAHMIHPYDFTITIKHMGATWNVTRNFHEIKLAHKALLKIAKKELGVSPNKIPKEEIPSNWPLFPTKVDTFITDVKTNTTCIYLSRYFRHVLSYPPYRDHPVILNLFSVSPLSFTTGVGNSLIEGMLYKKSSDTDFYGRCSRSRLLCQTVKLCYQKGWFCIKDSCIVFMDSEKDNYDISFVMLVDSEFKFKMKIQANANHAIKVKNLQNNLIMKFKSRAEQKEWYDKLDYLANSTAKLFCDKNFLRYGSFAPVRNDQLCKWYINGKNYMEDVMDGIINAKEEIFITDWWLCPELYLKRPTDDTTYRLDKLFVQKSLEGVKIYILLYNEVTLAVNLMSSRTRQILTNSGMNNNLKILRHPDHLFDGVFLWSHHEKMVVIDQSVAFMGGIDLCFGRWDDDFHRLVDLGKVENNTNIVKNSNSTMPISQSDTNFLHVRKAANAFGNSSQQTSPLNKANTHNPKDLSDLSENQIKIVSAFTTALVESQAKNKSKIEKAFMRKDSTENKEKIKNLPAKKPVVKWVTTKKQMVRGQKGGLRLFKHKLKIDVKSNIDNEIYDNWYEHGIENKSFDVDESPKELPKTKDIGYYYWIGKDYANTYQEDFKDINEFEKDQFDRTKIPRMPWRDEALVLIGKSARDLARHFIQRWNQCKQEQVPLIDSYPYLVPKTYETFDYDYRKWFKHELHNCDVQILRSADDWSVGISKTETSILNAYYDLIKNAEHYIYIENQFFVTTCDPKNDEDINNRIGGALADRIIEAHKKNQKFRVYVVLPLLPGFEKMNQIKAVQYYNLRSIKFGRYSIYEELKKAGINDPSEYITFHGMRNWSVLMGNLVNEIVYVHSKLMIVDDKHVICGSANINDRSMLGKRDSETAALITDKVMFESTLNNQKVRVGKYAFSLRDKIFKLHLGINVKNPNNIDSSDCVCDEFYKKFKTISHQNTLVYDEVFKCIPSNNILTFSDLEGYTERPCLKTTSPYEGKCMMEKNVNGFIVDFPLLFLANEENFFPDFDTAEGIVPTEIWT